MEGAPEAVDASAKWIERVEGVRREHRCEQDLEWPREYRRIRSRQRQRANGRAQPAAVRSAYAAVESLVGECGRWSAGPRSHGGQFRKWAGRVFQSSTNQGTLGAGSICFFRH